MSSQFIISSSQYLPSVMKELETLIDKHGFIKMVVTAGSNKSVSQNNLFWMWMTEMANYFASRGVENSTKDQMHDLMCHKFLGNITVTVGKTEITRLKSLRDLDKGDMLHFMRQIDEWSADHGVLLTHPEDSEYQRLTEVQNQ
jgi:hypothetical protein